MAINKGDNVFMIKTAPNSIWDFRTVTVSVTQKGGIRYPSFFYNLIPSMYFLIVLLIVGSSKFAQSPSK